MDNSPALPLEQTLDVFGDMVFRAAFGMVKTSKMLRILHRRFF